MHRNILWPIRNQALLRLWTNTRSFKFRIRCPATAAIITITAAATTATKIPTKMNYCWQFFIYGQLYPWQGIIASK